MASRRGSARTRTRTPRVRYKKVTIGRFDQELKEYAFDDGETVSQALDKAGINLGSGESVNDINGNEIDPKDKIRPGQTLIVVGNFRSGN